MSDTQGMQAVTLRAGERCHGFLVQTVTPLPALRANVYDCMHEASGARVVHLHTTDVENHVTIAVRTPPPDDTGVAHILEHVVLCGSHTYPVKELFIELVKRSLATELNGFTMADCTGYPLASCNRKDFFNLAEVYCDVVFHPLLDEVFFQQEGHHLAFGTPGDVQTPLEIKGIVYSEMKGAYSGLDACIEREVRRVLLGGNAYGFDAGGDPAAIPTLTYAQFLAFHRAHYHPANACFLLCGDIATEEHLAFLARVCLDGAPRGNVTPAIAPQPRWQAPRQATMPYAIAADEEPDRRAAVVLAYFTNTLLERETAFAMRVVANYLVGNQAAPLYRALLESRLGDALTSTGYVAYQRDAFFSVGLKGTEADQTGAIAALVQQVLAQEITAGFAHDKVAAAFHQIELAMREQVCTAPSYLLQYALQGWLHAQDPLPFLQFNEMIDTVRRQWEQTPRYFETLAARVLRDNPHHCVLTFVPDKEYDARAQQALAAQLASQKQRMSAAELATIARVAAELDAMQTAPNSAAALATLPRLRLADVPVAPQELPTTVEHLDGRVLLATDVFTNALTCITMALDLRGLPPALLPYLNVYAQLLPLMGAGDEDYASLAARSAGVCSSMLALCSTHNRLGAPDDTQLTMLVRSHALDRNSAAMLEIMRLRIQACDFRDRGRLRDVIMQQRAGMRDMVTMFSWYFARMHAEQAWSRSAWLRNQQQGLPQLQLLERLARVVDTAPDDLILPLEQIREYCAHQAPVTASVAGSAAALQHARTWLQTFSPAPWNSAPPPAWRQPDMPRCVGIAVAANVAANVTATRLSDAALADGPAMLLIRTALRHGYLWDEVRVRGNAYGVGAHFDDENGMFVLESSDDPQIARTHAVFQQVSEYIATQMDLSPAGVEQAVIDAVKALDRPRRGGECADTALFRYVTCNTPAQRAAFRTRFLALTRADVLRVNETHIRPALARATWCSFAGEAQLRQAAGELPMPLAISTPYAEE